MQSGKFLALALVLTTIAACAPNVAQTGTGSTVPAYSPVQRLEEFKVGEVLIRIEWGDYEKCEARVLYRTPEMKEFADAELVKVFVFTETEKIPSELIGCGSIDGNQRCQTCRFLVQRNPKYMKIQIGDRTYKVCICGCPNTPRCQ